MGRRDRDVEAFQQRAPGYEGGWRGRLHHEIVDRTVELALRVAPEPSRILDVGCGTGYLLRELAGRCPGAVALEGIDAAPGMIEVAAAGAAGAAGAQGGADGRLGFRVGTAERLPWEAGAFDLVVSSTSFDHWADQQAGLRECFRVLGPGGHLVLVDQFSAWLVPTLVGSRRGKARTKRRASRLLTAAGFGALAWRDLYAVIIRAVTAAK
jgi:ubiquinone/menaquinone biosynthesis C-methylase UbiE